MAGGERERETAIALADAHGVALTRDAFVQERVLHPHAFDAVGERRFEIEPDALLTVGAVAVAADPAERDLATIAGEEAEARLDVGADAAVEFVGGRAFPIQFRSVGAGFGLECREEIPGDEAERNLEAARVGMIIDVGVRGVVRMRGGEGNEEQRAEKVE